MPRHLAATSIAALALGCLAGCSVPATPSPIESHTVASSACPAVGPEDRAAPREAQPVDGGTPPPAPLRVEVRAAAPSRATVRVVAAPGTQYESSELRVFVDGCRVPWTDEGDQLPTQTVDGLRAGDRLQVLARLNGEGGNSAETASAVLTLP